MAPVPEEASCQPRKPADDAPDVAAVHYRDVFAVGDAGDCCRSVASEAGKEAKLFGVHGHFAFALGDDALCCLVQHARTAIVAKAAPQCENVLLGRGCERGERGESRQECIVAVDNGCDACLLQHDL